ncbi:MAG: hypothetical protein D6820_01075, partial [Lentisphaerae bacterium]
MRRIYQLGLLVWMFCFIVPVPKGLAGRFNDPEFKKQWQMTGNVGLDASTLCDGNATLRLGVGARAVWKIRKEDGSGRVVIRVKENGVKPANPKKRRVGPRWGIMQSDGRVLVVGVLYAPYLGNGDTYPVIDSDQKSWFTLQYVGEKRRPEWTEWTFLFDPEKGVSLLRNGRKVKRFNWDKTRIRGFCGVVLFGDTQKEPEHTLWVAEVKAETGPPMKVKPKGPQKGAASSAKLPDKDPAPAQRVELKPELATVHPRLLFTREDIAKMKRFIETPVGKVALENLTRYARGAAPPKGTPRFLRDATDGQRSGLWHCPSLGLHYLLTGDAKSKQRALAYLDLLMKLPHWETSRELDCGMSSANVAIGAALLYDWLYDELSPDFRSKFRDKLLTMARRQYYFGHLNRLKTNGYWQGDPLNNHRWHRNAGMVLCVLAAADPNKTDDDWILSKTKEELDYVARWLPPDGSSHEGPSYLIFGLAHLTLGMQAADHCLGTTYLE